MAMEDLEPLAEFFAVPEVAEWWPGENRARLRARLEDADEGVGFVIELDGAYRDIGVMHRYERANDGTWRDSLLIELFPEIFVARLARSCREWPSCSPPSGAFRPSWRRSSPSSHDVAGGG